MSKDEDQVKFNIPDMDYSMMGKKDEIARKREQIALEREEIAKARERSSWRGIGSVINLARFVMRKGKNKHGAKASVGKKRKRSLKRRARNKIARKSRRVNARLGSVGSSRQTWKRGRNRRVS